MTTTPETAGPLTPEDVVRRMMRAYNEQDLDTAQALLADDLSFTSPQDDHIDRAAFLERCFPTADRTTRQDLLVVTGVGDGRVYVTYEYDLKDEQGTWRNTELISVRDGQIHEIQVFFGGRYA
ncbi:nuclear transport factor 2 family protein [Nakamurella alba]|nr:nuclear transport factor 2 family protein [Nakamurella alba]